MSFEFIPLSLDIREEYEHTRNKCQVKSADYTFTNLWGWADLYGLSIAFVDGFSFIHQQYPYHCYWAPVGDWQNFDPNLIKFLPKRNEITSIKRSIYNEIPAPCGHSSNENKICLHRVPSVLVDIIMSSNVYATSHIQEIESRGQWEYIYAKQDLTTLVGNRFHKKRNHVNQFYKTYGKNYYPLHLEDSGKGSIEEVLFLQEEWCKWHDCEHSESLQRENDVIFRVVGSWSKLGNLVGGSLYVEDKMVAFAIAEEVSSDTLVVHFEKAQTTYRGAYQAINHSLINECAENYEFINREQDMDEEGLRKAKESYNPIDYLKKSTLVFTL